MKKFFFLLAMSLFTFSTMHASEIWKVYLCHSLYEAPESFTFSYPITGNFIIRAEANGKGAYAEATVTFTDGSTVSSVVNVFESGYGDVTKTKTGTSTSIRMIATNTENNAYNHMKWAHAHPCVTVNSIQ